MSIVRMSSLSTAELSLLGNNLDSDTRCAAASRKRAQRRLVRAVNRSMARFGECVGWLHRPLLAGFVTFPATASGVRVRESSTFRVTNRRAALAQ